MSEWTFFKYQGAGNDFVILDNRAAHFPGRYDEQLLRRWCDRRFGIGADGLILLEHHSEHDFRMLYFNADGREGSLCGNGGRCLVAFAHHRGLIGADCTFMAIDGPHRARVVRPDWVELEMHPVDGVELHDGHCFLDTGSPHYVTFVEDWEGLDVVAEGRKVRYSDRFREFGVNVNFVRPLADGIEIATYERGVEDETLACGTGVTAAAMAYYLQQPGPERRRVKVWARGGELEVRFHYEGGRFADVWLCGPARRVFQGVISDAPAQPS